MSTIATRPVHAARFLCRAAWRCAHPDCNTPWFARESYRRARDCAREHDYLVHGRLR